MERTELHPFDANLFQSLVSSRELELGRSFQQFAETTSTSDLLVAAMAQGAPHGLVVLADHQTAGRGRHGRTWSSDVPCENLLFSVLMRLNVNQDTLSNVTLAIGLALRDAVQPYISDEAGIKWTNDIVVQRRKLAGILVESQLCGAELALSIGIGLNVHMQSPPYEVRSIATSLDMLGARNLQREAILCDILEHIAGRIHQWQTEGFSSMLSDIREHDALCGWQVLVDGTAGRAEGIDDTGALLLRVDNESLPRHMINGFVQVPEWD